MIDKLQEIAECGGIINRGCKDDKPVGLAWLKKHPPGAMVRKP